ncbi:unnamed protein product [Arctogadus glacialis]
MKIVNKDEDKNESSDDDRQQEKKPSNPHYHHLQPEDTDMHRHRCCWPPAKMTYLVLVWTTVTCLCWTSGSAQVPVRYPKISDSEALTCGCHQNTCDGYLWFRSLENGSQLQFLVSVNNADRSYTNTGLDKSRFIVKMNSGKSTLRIANLKREDSGVYSCVSKDKQTEGLGAPGVLLLPGVTPPEPTPQPTSKPVCRCREKSHKLQPKGCGSDALWPSVGILAGLALALLATLYYFSRLPKKCRHHFVKKDRR